MSFNRGPFETSKIYFRSIKELDAKLQKARPLPTKQHAAYIKFHNNVLIKNFNIVNQAVTPVPSALVSSILPSQVEVSVYI